ncbi:MAG TPA: response regulator [Bacteroidota bacterium]|nr:response regulator [Bacteroidota bacterium]
MATSASILILEDDPAGIRLVTRKLEITQKDFKIHSSRSRAQYIDALKNNSFDCIILDYTLPDIDGLQALRIAQELAATTPAIIFTGSVGEERAIDCMKAGAYDYVLKTNSSRLIASVLSALEHKRLVEEKLRAEEELRRTHQQLIEILERISDGFFALDDNWRVTYINKRGAQILGKESEELMGKVFWDVFPDTVGQTIYKDFLCAFEEQKRLYFEEWHAPWRKWFETRIYPSPEGLSVFFTDVSDRKHGAPKPPEEEKS